MSEAQIGKVTHYFDHISVAVLALTKALAVGETVRFSGHTTDFKQKVASLQVEHKSIEKAKAGDDVAMKVEQRVHPNDAVFRVTGED
jgi:putative protease